jgi:hypothetical protein
MFYSASSFIKLFLSAAFCLVYLLSTKDPVEHTFFITSEIADEAAT